MYAGTRLPDEQVHAKAMKELAMTPELTGGLHEIYVAGLRDQLGVPADWRYVAATFAGEPLSYVRSIPQAEIRMISETRKRTAPDGARMTFFLSPVGIDHLRAKAS